MSDIAILISDMVKAGIDADIIGRTAELLAKREPVQIVDEQAERRREKDRERKRLRNSAKTEIKKTKRKKEPKKEKIINIYNIPPYIPPELWEEFVKMRKDIKKPLSERAAKGVLRNIEDLRVKGYDPPSLLRTATDREWLTVYEPKGNENEAYQRNKTRSERTADVLREHLAEIKSRGSQTDSVPRNPNLPQLSQIRDGRGGAEGAVEDF